MSTNIYSDWQRIDLHIHTDYSKRTKEGDYKGNFTVDVLHQKLIENDVAIFSLTDHNIINVDAYEEYYSKYNTVDDPLLLLGVELDITINATDGGEKAYHSLLIFNYNTFDKVKEISDKLESFYTGNIKERTITIEKIVDLFINDDFFFIPHAHNGHRGIIGPYSGEDRLEDAQKMLLLMHSPLEKVKEEVIHHYNLGFNRLLNDEFKNKEDIAYLRFSDNHNIESYPCEHKGEGDSGIHSFYYLKGSKNYETLRLAFIDPKSRILSSEKYEEIRHYNIKIENIKIGTNCEILESNELSFSPHLNVIIGGRSSGKSLLMNIFGHKIDIINNVEDKYKKVNFNNIQIKSSNDASYVNRTSISDNLIYINQGDIVKYFEKDELKNLAIKSEKLDDYNQAREDFIHLKNNLDLTIEELIESYDISHTFGLENNFVLHQNTIDSMISQNFVLKLNLELLKVRYDVSGKLEDSELLLKDFLDDLVLLESNDILEITSDDKTVIKDFKDLIVIKNELLNKIKNMHLKKINFLDSVNSLISQKNSTLDSESQIKNSSIKEHKRVMLKIKEKFKTSKKLRNSSYLLEEFNYSLQKNIELSEDVSLVLEVRNEEDIKLKILDGISDCNEDKSLYLNLLSLLKNENEIKVYKNNEPENLKKKIFVLTKGIREKLDKPKDYLGYINTTTSEDNSPGYNSEQYLKIILENNNNKIIFIDQPEDNLGNRFITTELVNILRKIKFKKQIFLITHNPSIVVYGDAESIIVSTNNSNKISYKQVVLENKESQKEICDVLDGGQYIFNNRAQKYNIQRLIKEEV